SGGRGKSSVGVKPHGEDHMRVLKHAARIIGVVALVAFGSAFADNAKDLAALRAVDEDWTKAFNAGNAEVAANLYDEMAVLMPPGQPAITGRAAIKAWLAKDMEGAKKAGVTFNLGPKAAGGVSGNMGWQSGTYTATDKSGKVVETGKYLSVSEKKGGKWLY